MGGGGRDDDKLASAVNVNVNQSNKNLCWKHNFENGCLFTVVCKLTHVSKIQVIMYKFIALTF